MNDEGNRARSSFFSQSCTDCTQLCATSAVLIPNFKPPFSPTAGLFGRLRFRGGLRGFSRGLVAHVFFEGGALAAGVLDGLSFAGEGVAALSGFGSTFGTLEIDGVHGISLPAASPFWDLGEVVPPLPPNL